MVLLSAGRKAAVHVDLDGARHIYRVHGWTDPAGADRLFETGVEGALELFGREGIVATFFAIAEDLDDPVKRGLLEEIVRRGHEIASHTITHRRLTELSEPERRREIGVSKTRLEDALGVPVSGFRAPAFACDDQVLAIVAAAGYRYDSSLLGGGRVPVAPHRWTGGEMLELPLPAKGPLPVPFHPSYSLVLGSWYFRLGLARAVHRVPLFVLLFHLTDFAAPLDRASLGPRGSRVYTLSYLGRDDKRRRCAAMVAAVRAAYPIVPTAALVADLVGETLAERPS